MSKNWYKNSKELRDSIVKKLTPGSLWICHEPHWYFYEYSTLPNGGLYILQNGGMARKKQNRHIKYVQQKTGYFAYKEELITESEPLFLIETFLGVYYFLHKLETIEMRSEFMYRFVKDFDKQ